MVQPWFCSKTGGISKCDLTLKYIFNIKDLPHKLKLAIETPSEFVIKVNGKDAVTRTEDYWVDSCFKIFEVANRKNLKKKNGILRKSALSLCFACQINWGWVKIIIIVQNIN